MNTMNGHDISYPMDLEICVQYNRTSRSTAGVLAFLANVI